MEQVKEELEERDKGPGPWRVSGQMLRKRRREAGCHSRLGADGSAGLISGC